MLPQIEEFLWQTRRTEIPVSTLAAIAIDSPVSISDLVTIATNIENPDANWRAAWILTKIAETDSSKLQNFAPKLISFLLESTNKCSNGLLRGLLRTLTELEYSYDEDGKLLDLCTKIFKSRAHSKAARVNAMRIVTNITLKHPELKEELITEFQIIELQETKSVVAACRILRKRLQKNKSRQ